MPAKLLRPSDDELAVDLSECRGSEFADAKTKVRDIVGRRWDPEAKLWMIPNDPATAEKAYYSLQPETDPAIIEWMRDARATYDAELVSALPEDADGLLIPWANARAPWQPELVNDEPYEGLKPHQRAWVAEVTKSGEKLRAILADDMGLGKTLQAISAVAEDALRGGTGHILETGIGFSTGEEPKLVICPNSVKGVWAREVTRWLGPEEPVQIIDATTAKARHNQLERIVADGGWAIVNYEQLRVVKQKIELRNGGEKTITVMKEPLFEKTDWLAVIADEVHRAKNRKAKQTQGLYRIQGALMLGATGTPLMNSPDELWSILHWLFPKEYTSYWRFFETYVDYTEGYFGRVITGVKNPDALRFELQGRLYRRTKGQVLDLPEKTRIRVPVKLGPEQRKLYTEAERSLWLEVEKAVQEGDQTAERLVAAAAEGSYIYAIPNGAARTVRLRQILATPALLGGKDISAKLDAVEEAILDNAHKPHVVFSEFVETCTILAERLRAKGLEVETYTGKTEEHKRTRLEDAFQRGEINVLIGTIGAMREGITLTAADTQHWIDRSWVPGWNEQGEDRSHRIGQVNRLTIYIYEGEDTVDDGKIAPTNRLKERIVATVLPKDEIKETTK